MSIVRCQTHHASDGETWRLPNTEKKPTPENVKCCLGVVGVGGSRNVVVARLLLLVGENELSLIRRQWLV